MSKQNHVPAWLDDRAMGVLLHPTSLPGPGDNGVLGKEAYNFVDFLCACGAKVWQILPLVPTHEDRSPYMGLSVLAGNPDLICQDFLRSWGWINEASSAQVRRISNAKKKREVLITAARVQVESNADTDAAKQWEEFLTQHSHWLDDYSLFCLIRSHESGRSWTEWPKPLRDRDAKALKGFKNENFAALRDIQFEQFVFFKQWLDLKRYANEHGIQIFGDMPIFVAHDSAEVWANPEQFDLLEDGSARSVAGVPPDYFSETGQRWGNPHYNWRHMQENDFAWWRQRVANGLELYDLMRVDHFRGFEAYWEIDAQEPNAIKGRWVKAPGRELFQSLNKHFHHLPLVAEDLGTIDDEVLSLRDDFEFPGMKILQFGFDGNPENPYLPHNFIPNCVVYTGTHDNDTSVSWWQLIPEDTRTQLLDYLGDDHASLSRSMPWPLIRMALASTAILAILPLQDMLSLGAGHRMNTPGSQTMNWSWRYEWQQVGEDIAGKIRALNKRYGRCI